MPGHTHAQEETSHCRPERLSWLTLLVGYFSTSLTCSLAATYFCTPLVFPPHLAWFPFSLLIPSAAASCFLNNPPEAMSPTFYSASLVLFSTPTPLHPHSQDFTIAQQALLVFLFCPFAWSSLLSSLHLLQLGETLNTSHSLLNLSVHTS